MKHHVIDAAVRRRIGVSLCVAALAAVLVSSRPGVPTLHAQAGAGEKLDAALVSRLAAVTPAAIENQAITDTSSGHGTHVAGIIGGTGAASSGYYRGVETAVKMSRDIRRAIPQTGRLASGSAT